MYNKHATEKGLSSFGICKTISGRLLSSSAESLDLKCSDLFFDPIIRIESHKKATLVNRSSAVFLIPTQHFRHSVTQRLYFKLLCTPLSGSDTEPIQTTARLSRNSAPG